MNALFSALLTTLLITTAQSAAAAPSCGMIYRKVIRQDSFILSTKELPENEARAAIAGDKAVIEKYKLTPKERTELGFLLSTAKTEVERLFAEVSEFLQPVVGLPAPITMRLAMMEASPAAHLNKNLLRIGYVFPYKNENGKSVVKSPVLTKVINTHEFGHLVLEASIKRLPFVNELREKSMAVRQERYEQLLDQIGPQLDRIEKLDSDIASVEGQMRSIEKHGVSEIIKKDKATYLAERQAEIDVLKQEKAAIQKEILPILEQTSFLSDGMFAKDFFEPYHELFADLVPVLFYNNRKIVAEALNNGKNEKISANRAFVTSDKVEDLDIGLSHDALRKVRAFIGEELIPKAKTVEDRQKIIQVVLRAILEEGSAAYHNSEYIFTNREANQRLIERIQRRMNDKSSTDLPKPADQ